jgi:hypothetical protein
VQFSDSMLLLTYCFLSQYIRPKRRRPVAARSGARTDIARASHQPHYERRVAAVRSRHILWGARYLEVLLGHSFQIPVVRPANPTIQAHVRSVGL